MMEINKKNGLTLIEVIFAIFIFSMGILTAGVVLYQNYKLTRETSQKLIAVYLAQEGIEIVRNIRDSNLLIKCYSNPNYEWKTGIDHGDWEADYNTTELVDDYDGDSLNIYNNFYTYDASSISTKFKRKITIDHLGNDTIRVIVRVYQQDKELFSITTYLYNIFETVKKAAESYDNPCKQLL